MILSLQGTIILGLMLLTPVYHPYKKRSFYCCLVFEMLFQFYLVRTIFDIVFCLSYVRFSENFCLNRIYSFCYEAFFSQKAVQSQPLVTSIPTIMFFLVMPSFSNNSKSLAQPTVVAEWPYLYHMQGICCFLILYLIFYF